MNSIKAYFRMWFCGGTLELTPAEASALTLFHMAVFFGVIVGIGKFIAWCLA